MIVSPRRHPAHLKRPMGLLLQHSRNLLYRLAIAIFYNVLSGLELIIHIVFEDSSATILNGGRALECFQPKRQRLWAYGCGKAQQIQGDQLDP